MEGQLQTYSKTGDISASIKSEINNPVKIRNISDVEQIKQVLRYIFIFVGLKKEQVPDEGERAVLLEYVMENFGNYTPEEIKLAFKIMIKNQSQIEVEHYGKFSCKYLQSVFNAYVEHRNKIALEVERERQRLEARPDPNEEQRKIEAFKKESIEIYQTSVEQFNGTKYHAAVLYEMVKGKFTREELVKFKKKAGKELHDLKKEFEERRKYGQVMVGELAHTSFTESEWRRRTALKAVNEAAKRGYGID